MSGIAAAGALAFIGLALGCLAVIIGIDERDRRIARRLLIVAFVFTVPALVRLWTAAIVN